jgi:hypothetical protein
MKILFVIRCLLLAGITLTSSGCDYGLIFFRDKGTFTLRYNVPDDLKGKMFTIASWSSDSFLCQDFSLGQGRFVSDRFGKNFENIEIEPGVWESKIKTQIWHPFCSWSFGGLTIGVDTNKEKNNWFTLANGYIARDKNEKSKLKNQNTNEDTNVNTESLLICDRREHDSEHTERETHYRNTSFSLDCENPRAQGATNMSATPVVFFHEGNVGILSVKYTGNIIKHIRRHSDDGIIYKKLIYINGELTKIETNPSSTRYWEVYSCNDGRFKIIFGTRGVSEPDFTKTTSLSKEQIEYLVRGDIAELPNYILQ